MIDAVCWKTHARSVLLPMTVVISPELGGACFLMWSSHVVTLAKLSAANEVRPVKLNVVVPAMPAQVCLKVCVILLCSQVGQGRA